MRFIKWYKGLIDKFMEILNIDFYTLTWTSWLKGIMTGLIIYHILIM